MLRRRGAWILLSIALLIAGIASTLPSAHAAGPQLPLRHTGGFVPVIGGHVRPNDNCPPSGCGSGDLLDHGGPVMATNAVYTVFWIPPGQSVSSNYVSTINQFFQDVAHDNGLSSNVYAVDTQYSSILYSSSFGGTFTDTSAFPANGCNPYGGASVCLEDSQVQSELEKVISQQGWQKNGTNMFFLFTPQDVESCDPGNGCAFTDYCAYHGFANDGLIYANQPYAVSARFPGSCDTGESPNGDDADSTINVASHEHNEAITDPQLDAWFDQAGWEIGDKCAWTFGTRSGPGGAEYNQTIAGRHYFLQEEYSNATSSCVQSYQIQGGGPGPTVSGFSPAGGPVGTEVDVQGTGFTGATDVSFGGASDPSFVVDSDTDITAHVPGGATSGTISVTTPAGTGTSSTSFTVTTTAPPAITSVKPTRAKPGATIDIRGSGFAATTGVTLRFVDAAYTVVSDTEIKATVPGMTGGWGHWRVTTPSGTADGGPFYVVNPAPKITSVTPTRAHHGARITIRGSHFTGTTSVTLRWLPATYTLVSDTKIVASVPSIGKGWGHWRVTTSGGTADGGPFYVTG